MSLRLLIPLLLVTAPGCLWTPKPYSHDPLVHNRRALLGDTAKPPVVIPFAEPVPPTPPSDSAP